MLIFLPYEGKYIVNISEKGGSYGYLCVRFVISWIGILFLNGVIFVFLRVEPWGGRVGVTYATCMTVSDLMWILLLNVHSFIQNNKLCILSKTYVDLKS